MSNSTKMYLATVLIALLTAAVMLNAAISTGKAATDLVSYNQKLIECDAGDQDACKEVAKLEAEKNGK